MPEKYLYNGQLVDRKDIEAAAKQSKLDVNAYLQKAGIKTVNDNYKYNGTTMAAADVLEAANESGLGFEEYVGKAGLEALPDEVKKKDTLEVLADFGKIVAGSSQISSEVKENEFGEPLTGLSYLKNSAKQSIPFSLTPTEEQIKQYNAIEKSQVQEAIATAGNIADRAFKGIVTADELADLYNSPRGKELATNLVNYFVPELEGMGGGLEKEVFGSEKKWNNIARKIKEKNRANGVNIVDESYARMNQEMASMMQGAKTAIVEKGDAGGRSGGPDTYTEDIVISDFDDLSQYAQAINQLKRSSYLTGPNVTTGGKEKLLAMLQSRAMLLNQKKPLPDEIKNISDKIRVAVSSVNVDRERAGLLKPEEYNRVTEIDQQNFEKGLSYIQDVDPGKYKNVIRAITEKEKVADIDFRYLSRIGQEINNENIFRDGATNPESIDKETDFDYMTRQDKKSMYASAIGEYLKDQGFSARQFSKKQIAQAALNLGLDNKGIVDELAAEEGILFYDAIPKSGGVEAFVRGVMTPFQGIKKTVDVVTKDDSEVYLNSQQYDVGIGGQKVSDAEGQMSTRLPSDRGNIWYDALEGFGQFIPQVVLTRGIGAPLASAARTAAAIVPRGALTAAQSAGVINYGGTFISTYLQEYGSSYEDALVKTGDPGTAKAMGAINGISAASFELFLPDTKIASQAAGIFRKNYAGDIIDIIKKGGSVADIKRQGRNVIQKFVGETLEITKQEVKEEVGTQLINYITESIFSPQTAADRNIGDELLETAKATAISMIIPAVLGGAGSANGPKDFTVNGLHSAAIQIESSKNALDKALIDEQVSQPEYNNILQVLNTHRQSIENAPKESSTGKVLSTSERYEYAYQDTVVKELNEQLKKASTNVTKEDVKNKISKAEDVQKQILGVAVGEQTGDDSWKNRVQTIEQEKAADIKLESDVPLLSQREVEDSILNTIPEDKKTDAVSFVNEMVEGDLLPNSIRATAVEFPLSFLEGVADQAFGLTRDSGRNRVKAADDTVANVNSQYTETVVNYAKRLFPFAPEVREEVVPIQEKSDVDIEKRMLEIEGDKNSKAEFNELEKEMEKRERETVFNAPLGKVVESVDALLKKDKDMPNGFGSFIEKSDAAQTKEVANRYLKADELTDQDIKKDFRESVMGNPDTWYADGLKLRESLKEAANRGIDTQEMVAEVEKIFIKDGFTVEEAKSVVAAKLAPIFKDSQKVEIDNSKLISNETSISSTEAVVAEKKLEQRTRITEERDVAVREAMKPELPDFDFSDAESLRELSKGDKKEYKRLAQLQSGVRKQLKQLENVMDCVWGKK